MQIPKSAIFVAGLSIALFLITLIVISITAHQENAAKPQPTEEKAEPPILLEYKPNDKISLILRGHNDNKNASESKTILAYEYSIYNGTTNKEIFYTHWIQRDDDTREVEIKNNKLILKSSIYVGTYPNGREIPFLKDEFYVEDGKLWHASVVTFKRSDIDEGIIASSKNKVLKYKNLKHQEGISLSEEDNQELLNMPGDLFTLALCGDSEAIRLLKDRDAYIKYFHTVLDGGGSEIYGTEEGAYDTFEYLQHQGGSIKEVIPLDNPNTTSTSVQHSGGK